MAATSHIARFILHVGFVVVAAAAIAGTALTIQRDATAWHPPVVWEDGYADFGGTDGREPATHRATIEAAFDAQSYRTGGTARLVLFQRARDITIRLYRVADAHGMLVQHDRMRGVPIGDPVHVRSVRRGDVLRFALRGLPSALYYAQLTNRAGTRVGYAPVVVAPARLGMHHIALVEPTQTWQAYNYRDDDRNGSSDTWYVDGTTARLARPFLDRGVPPHYRCYDEPFIRWLARNDIEVDVLSDTELARTSGERLAQAYDLMIFSGHHEYVTSAEYDAVARYRDLGGNLMFLSANNFFWKVTIEDGVMTRLARWRDLGRPESALIGVQYYANDNGEHRGAWSVRSSRAGRWIFAGTGLGSGSSLSNGGIEADHVTASSPAGTQVLAEIRNLFGDGRNAQMTFYTAPSGAKVFAAGAFSLGISVWQPPVRRLMANLITALGETDDVP